MENTNKQETQAVAPSSLWRDAVKRFCKNKTAVVALIVLALMALAAIFAGVISPYGPYDAELSQVKAGPSAQHWFGCDENGRDILTRILYGARISLSVGFISVLISTVIGSIIGLSSAYYGGAVDAILSRFMEMIQSFPSILLAIIFMSVFGRGIENAVIAIAIVSIPGPARIIRSSALGPGIQDGQSQGGRVVAIRADIGVQYKMPFFHFLFLLAVQRPGQGQRHPPGLPGGKVLADLNHQRRSLRLLRQGPGPSGDAFIALKAQIGREIG